VPFTIRLQGKFHRSNSDDSATIINETKNKNVNPDGGKVLPLYCTTFLPVFWRPITVHHLVVLHFFGSVATILKMVRPPSCYYVITQRKKKLKWSRYRTGVAQRVGRGIVLLFHDRGTRRGWVVSSTPRPHFTPGKDTISILQEAGWAPGPVWTGEKSRPHRDSIPDRPARIYPAHLLLKVGN